MTQIGEEIVVDVTAGKRPSTEVDPICEYKAFLVDDVHFVTQQPKTKACGFAAVTMILSWRDQVQYSMEQVMDKLDKVFPAKGYRKTFNKNTGLTPDDFREFATDYDLVVPGPMGISFALLKTLLKEYGPIGVNTTSSTEALLTHVWVIIGVVQSSDCSVRVQYYDPAGTDIESAQTSFEDFQSHYERTATRNTWALFHAKAK
jgi:hypothetical protein